MRPKLSVIAALAAAALVCAHCAPADRAKKGQVLKTNKPKVGPDGKALGPDGKPLDSKDKSADGKNGPGGKCQATPDKGDLQDIRKANQTRAQAANPITIDQLPAGTYTLKDFSATYSVQSNDVNFESVVEFSILMSGVGPSQTATKYCQTNTSAGQMKPPAPQDGGRDILIDAEFTLGTNNGAATVTSGQQVVLRHQVRDGTTTPVATLMNPSDPSARVQAGTETIMSALAHVQATGRMYTGVIQTQQPSTIIVSQVPQQSNAYQVYLEIPEGPVTVPTTRGIYLIYELKSNAAGATPQQPPANPQQAPQAPAQQQPAAPPAAANPDQQTDDTSEIAQPTQAL